MRFKIDWASLIVGSKFIVLALLYFVFEGNFLSTSPQGAYIWSGDLQGSFCVTGLGGIYLEGLIHGGAYFRNFVIFCLVYQGVFGHFTTLQDYFRRFPKATEDYKLLANTT